jgi:hypothetical protein
MKRKILSLSLTFVCLCMLTEHGTGQVLWNGFGQYNLTGGGATLPSNFTIGNSASTGSALIVRGDQMGTPTGEVFRTTGPNGVDTHWRLFKDAMSLEVGHLFALNADENFHINGASGDIRFWTFESSIVGSLQRARLKRSGAINIGSYAFQPITGHYGVGSFGSTVNNPYTLFHADSDGSNDEGYRPGMREGMSSSRGAEYGYVGLIAVPTGSSDRDYGIVWSRELTASGPASRLRFIYTGTDGTVTQASSQPGLEIGRFEPAVSLNEGFFGVGNWTFAGLTPNERLDVMDGGVKFRDLPLPAYQDNTLTKVLVVDDLAPNFGKLKWRDVSSFACSSGWSLTGTTTATAYDGNPCPPQGIDHVGIGTTTPLAKLDVVKEYQTGGTDVGVRSEILIDVGTKAAYEGINVRAGDENFGITLGVDGASRNWGVVSLPVWVPREVPLSLAISKRMGRTKRPIRSPYGARPLQQLRQEGMAGQVSSRGNSGAQAHHIPHQVACGRYRIQA